MHEHPRDVAEHVGWLYDEARRHQRCRARTPAEFREWQVGARSEFHRLLGIPQMAAETEGHEVVSSVSPSGEDMGHYVRQRGWIRTEPPPSSTPFTTRS